MSEKQLILFDGVCVFCNWSVNFVINRDPSEKFVFAPLQSPLGQVMMDRYHLHSKPDTFVLIRNDECFVMSAAALKVAGQLTGLWPLMTVFYIVPSFLRDPIYRLFGRYRYRLFGQSDQCMVPDPQLRARFIGQRSEF